MRVETFLDRLRNAMPTREALEEYGLDDDEIADIQSTFAATSQPIHADNTVSKREIERMIDEFDCSNVEIGLIRFEGQCRIHPHGIIFAYCESDPLVILEDGRIALFDSTQPDFSRMECATNSECFLDALAAFIDIIQNKADWSGHIEDAAALCANAAGGSQHQEFFRMLCGFIR